MHVFGCRKLVSFSALTAEIVSRTGILRLMLFRINCDVSAVVDWLSQSYTSDQPDTPRGMNVDFWKYDSKIGPHTSRLAEALKQVVS